MFYEVFDNIYKIELPIPFPLKTMKIYFVDDAPKTLVDAGIKTEASFDILKKGLEAIGYGLDSIERVLITHSHDDHYGQAKRWFSLSGAPIYIHPKEYGRIRSIIQPLGYLKPILMRNGAPEALVNGAIQFIESAQNLADPLEETLFFNDGDVISFKMIWKTLFCPGHSPGLICFHWPEKNLICRRSPLKGNHP
jgi:glyoxylase-like metal-dependent hydrolase (beta-lactamase superfamily II)